MFYILPIFIKNTFHKLFLRNHLNYNFNVKKPYSAELLNYVSLTHLIIQHKM